MLLNALLFIATKKHPKIIVPNWLLALVKQTDCPSVTVSKDVVGTLPQYGLLGVVGKIENSKGFTQNT